MALDSYLIQAKNYASELKLNVIKSDLEETIDDAQNKLKHLSSLKFIQEGQNVILAGNPGTGKTHIEIALGIKACLEGCKVLFATVPLFITQLKELKSF